MVFYKKLSRDLAWGLIELVCEFRVVKIIFVCELKCATTRNQQPINLQEYFEHFGDLEAFVHSALGYYQACPFSVGVRGYKYMLRYVTIHYGLIFFSKMTI